MTTVLELAGLALVVAAMVVGGVPIVLLVIGVVAVVAANRKAI